MKTIKIGLLSLLIFATVACSDQSDDLAHSDSISGLELVPEGKSGISFNNTLSDNPLSDKNVLSYQHYFNGAGVGVADFNQDGLQDIFFAGNEVPNELYINKGDWKFEKLGPEAGINKNKVWSAGVSIVDINNDSYPDIYVSQQGPYEESQRRNLFYINNKNLSFTESAAAMGLDDGNYSTQAAFFDYDKDGDLDCYVMNESKYAGVILRSIYIDLEKKENMIAASGKLFENLGNLTFKDVTEKAGVLNYGYGLGLSIADINGDNWPDIYVANDYTVPDFMYINQKDGSFKESIKEFTKQISYFGMGCDIADINNDGLVDIGVVDMAAEDHFRDKTLMAGMDSEGFKYYFYELGYQFQYMFNSLQLNNGNNTFSNIAALAGVLKSDWSWAALFVDLNLDGYKDYYVSNGFRRYSRDNDFRIKMKQIRDKNNGSVPLNMREEIYKLMPEIKLNNKLYINNKHLHFDESSEFSHPDFPTFSYGVAYADFDNDGDFDLVINNIDQAAQLLKNTIIETSNTNYIKVRLDSENQARKINSKVYLYIDDEIQIQEYSFVRGYESTMEEVLIFGLGNHSTIDSLKILWSDDNVQLLNNVEANQDLTIKYEKQNSSIADHSKDSYFQAVDPIKIGVDFKHSENHFDDFEQEILLPQKQSAFGPALAVADVNNDKLDDFYVGGAKNQSGRLYIQNPNGSFTLASRQPWEADIASEDVAAIFIDPNNDGNKDLLVVSGGSGDFIGDEANLHNRFYANIGGGQFGKIGNILPPSLTASYSIEAANIDNDDELEILVLGAARPGKYPISEKAILYDYQDQSYKNIINEVAPDLVEMKGLIRDAEWVDLNNDGNQDLITVGEWQNVEVFISENGKLVRRTENWGIADKQGWWRSIEKADLDEDGDMDFIVGNVGVNFKQKASGEHPLYLYSNDFDGNGTLDVVLAKDYNDKIVPTRGRQCSSEQMPFIEDKFETFNAFASASIGDILGNDKIDSGIKLKAVDFHSYIMWNEGNKFRFDLLPVLSQSFPINDIIVTDFNADNKSDIILVGNDYNTEYETPRLDAGRGLALMNLGNSNFESLTVQESGIYCPQDAKRMRILKSANNNFIIVANNNSNLDFLKINQ